MSMNQRKPTSAREALKLERPMSVAVYDEYSDAAQAVDYLSDRSFPVEMLAIVGTDLKSIEKVTGQVTWGKILLAGFMQGAMWAGMFSIIMWLMQPQLGLVTILAMAFAGFGLIGMAIAAVQYKLRGNDRDYTSTTTIIAAHYEVLAEATHADRARHLLSGGSAHQTREVAAHPRPQLPSPPMAAMTSAEQVDLAALPAPYGLQPSPDSGRGWQSPEAPAVPASPAEPPQAAAGGETAASQPYGQYWSDEDAPGIGDVPASFQPPRRTADESDEDAPADGFPAP